MIAFVRLNINEPEGGVGLECEWEKSILPCCLELWWSRAKTLEIDWLTLRRDKSPKIVQLTENFDVSGNIREIIAISRRHYGKIKINWPSRWVNQLHFYFEGLHDFQFLYLSWELLKISMSSGSNLETSRIQTFSRFTFPLDNLESLIHQNSSLHLKFPLSTRRNSISTTKLSQVVFLSFSRQRWSFPVEPPAFYFHSQLDFTSYLNLVLYDWWSWAERAGLDSMKGFVNRFSSRDFKIVTKSVFIGRMKLEVWVRPASCRRTKRFFLKIRSIILPHTRRLHEIRRTNYLSRFKDGDYAIKFPFQLQ